MKHKIVIDSDIPYIRGVLEPYFSVEYLSGCAITRSAVCDASALVIRTRTKCTAELLEGSKVEAIATATIGTDHIDSNYCAENNIELYSAKGCNSRAVVQWLFSAIKTLQQQQLLGQDYTLGIIGVGDIGGKVAAIAEEMGIKTLLCDPIKGEYVEKEEIFRRCDVITLHVNLNSTSIGMVNSELLSLLSEKSILINSSRGEVIVEEEALNCKARLILDVWRGEPNINRALLERCTLSTPHIAGYSARGKARATSMSVQHIAHHFGIEELYNWDISSEFELEDIYGCDITAYNEALRNNPQNFEKLRTIR